MLQLSNNAGKQIVTQFRLMCHVTYGFINPTPPLAERFPKEYYECLNKLVAKPTGETLKEVTDHMVKLTRDNPQPEPDPIDTNQIKKLLLSSVYGKSNQLKEEK